MITFPLLYYPWDHLLNEEGGLRPPLTPGRLRADEPDSLLDAEEDRQETGDPGGHGHVVSRGIRSRGHGDGREGGHRNEEGNRHRRNLLEYLSHLFLLMASANAG